MAGIFLVGILFWALAAGLIMAAILCVVYRKSLRQKWPIIIAMPIGCMAAPIAALLVLIGVSALLQKSDRSLYQEIFGHKTTMGEDRLLSDDFGLHDDRRIYMHAEVLASERRKILATPGLVSSDLTMDQIIAVGASNGLSWWIEDSPFLEYQRCDSGKIYEAPGFNGWDDFVVVECPQRPNHTFMQLGHTDFIYVIATRTE